MEWYLLVFHYTGFATSLPDFSIMYRITFLQVTFIYQTYILQKRLSNYSECMYTSLYFFNSYWLALIKLSFFNSFLMESPIKSFCCMPGINIKLVVKWYSYTYVSFCNTGTTFAFFECSGTSPMFENWLRMNINSPLCSLLAPVKLLDVINLYVLL